MKRVISIITLLAGLIFSSCEKDSRASFESIDYYKGNDIVMHGYASPCLDYFILEFKDGKVEFSEAYHNANDPKRWTKKGFNTYGDMSHNAHFPIKNKGTYERDGDEVVFHGLNASNYVNGYIEFTRAEIRGEKAGTVNIDVYYTAKLRTGEKSGKINFIGYKY